MATNYERGRRYEYRSMRWLEKQGFRAYRTAGSHGEFDVVAISSIYLLLVQVKFNCVLTPGEREQFELLPCPPHTIKVIHIWYKGKREPDTEYLTTHRKEAA